MPRWLTALVTCAPPLPGKNGLLRLLGHRIGSGVRIDPSWLAVDRLVLGDRARVGAGNVVVCRRLVLRDGASLGHANMMRGPFSILLGRDAAIGHRMEARRADWPVTYGPATLRLGPRAKLTVAHFLDLTRSITLGPDVVIAGRGSQFWTHGYYHRPDGTRFRVDGAISIGRNVYVGSMSMVSFGVDIADGAVVGGHSVVAKSLESGMYVSQPLRALPLDWSALEARLVPVNLPGLCEPVFVRKGAESVAGKSTRA